MSERLNGVQLILLWLTSRETQEKDILNISWKNILSMDGIMTGTDSRKLLYAPLFLSTNGLQLLGVLTIQDFQIGGSVP